MKKRIIVLALICVFSLMLKGETVNQKNLLLKLDTALSAGAAKDGILRAFYPNLTGSSALFPVNGHPLMGKDACKAAVGKTQIQKLKWEPLLAGVSAAGDLGYTHGRFKKGETFAYYFTIWRKTAGQWKIAVSQGLLPLKDYPAPLIPKKHRIDPATADAVTKTVWDNELAFSRYSVEHGAAKAFYQFMADDGRAISFGGPPNTKDVYKKAMDRPKGKNALEWKPFYSFVSASADMAYNFGPYTFTAVNAEGKKTENYGYFITVWKKQLDGKWKFVIDGGNTSPAQK